MTNAKQIRQVYGPLLERYDDLAAIRSRSLWIKPIRHVALQIIIERTSHKDYTAPQWCILETFLLNPRLDMSLDHKRGYVNRRTIDEGDSLGASDAWRWASPTMLDELIDVIEHDILPFMRSISTLEACADFYRRRFKSSLWENPEDRLIVDIALGDLDIARESCRELLPRYEANKHPDWPIYQRMRNNVIMTAEPLMAGDRKALAAILHGWEAENIRGTKLEPYWESTPFPLEMM